jgi:hypothetical protein
MGGQTLYADDVPSRRPAGISRQGRGPGHVSIPVRRPRRQMVADDAGHFQGSVSAAASRAR